MISEDGQPDVALVGSCGRKKNLTVYPIDKPYADNTAYLTDYPIKKVIRIIYYLERKSKKE